MTGLTALSGQVYLFQIAAQADFGNAAKEEKIMRKLNCKPGDLAIVVEAFNPVNIGAIVKVIGKHRNQRVLCASPEEFIWLIEAPHPLTYEVKGKLVRKRKGGATDSGLQPIRGLDIIKGEHPSSTYYAAELRKDIDHANQVARDMGLDFRFRLA